MNVEDTITRIYVEVDDFCKRELAANPLRSRGFDPSLSDAEVLTMEIVGELQGRHDDSAIWRYFNDHGRGWFPSLGAYKTFAKHCANVAWLKQRFLAFMSPPEQSALHIIDGVPMPVCRTVRAMPDSRPKAEVSLMMKIRRRVETAIGILSEKFAITRIKARDLWHFTSKLTRKLIAYNFYLRFRPES